MLQRKIHKTKPWHVIKVDESDDKFSWLEELKSQIKIADSRILLLNEKQNTNGIMGLVNCVRKEPGKNKIFFCSTYFTSLFLCATY